MILTREESLDSQICKPRASGDDPRKQGNLWVSTA